MSREYWPDPGRFGRWRHSKPPAKDETYGGVEQRATMPEKVRTGIPVPIDPQFLLLAR